MRKLLLSLSLLLAFGLSLVFVACGDDDDSSFFRYNGQEYGVNEAKVVRFGQYSDDIHWNNIHFYAGEKDFISIDLYTKKPGKNLISGEYLIYKDEEGQSADMTFKGAVQSGDQTDVFVAGAVVVQVSEGHHQISYNCRTSLGKTVTGQYKGKPQYADGILE